MLDQLLKLVEQSAQAPIVQNKDIPDQLNNAAIKEVTNQILTSLKGQVGQGNIQQVISLFQSNNAGRQTNPVVATIISSVASSLTTKFNISTQVAQSVANNLVPAVINQVIQKTNDPKDIDFDLQQMMRGMSGNNSLDISSFTIKSNQQSTGSITEIFGKLFRM